MPRRRTHEGTDDDSNFRAWFVFEPWRLAIGAAPKVGTRSIALTIAQHLFPGIPYEAITPGKLRRVGAKLGLQRISASELGVIPEGFHRLGVVREPLERFGSLWRCQIRDRTAGVLGAERFSEIKTPKDLMAVIEQHPNANAHWCHQYPLLRQADELVRLEDLGEWWTGFFGPDGSKLQQVNTTAGSTPITPELEHRVLTHYAKDERLYEGI